MEIQWIKHRAIVAAYYRSANAYVALCRRENLSSAGMNPVEVQIIEHVIENADENHNMTWLADRLGISKSAFTNYVKHLCEKGLLEKYVTSENRKNIILKVTDAGLSAYNEYSTVMQEVFLPIFAEMDKLSEEAQAHVIDMLNAWADQHLIGTTKDKQFVLIPVDKNS